MNNFLHTNRPAPRAPPPMTVGKAKQVAKSKPPAGTATVSPIALPLAHENMFSCFFLQEFFEHQFATPSCPPSIVWAS